MLGYTNRLKSLLLLVLVVTGSLVAGTGTVSATHDDTAECGYLDALTYGFTFGLTNQHCTVDAQVDAAVHSVQEAESNQTKLDIYSAATTQKAERDTFETTMGNYLNDTRSVAWMKAEKAIAQTYEDGGSEAEAKIAAREAISKYYATKQKQVLNSYNASVSSAVYLQERSVQEGFTDYVVADYTDTSYQGEYHWDGNTSERSVTLVNSNTTNVTALEVYGIDTRADPDLTYDEEPAYPGGGYASFTYDNGAEEANFSKVYVKPPNSNYEDNVVIVDFHQANQHFTKIETLNSELQSEANVFVNNTYGDFEAGTINSTDVISRTTMMFEYGVQSGNESAGMWNSIAALSSMGLDTPDLNGTGVMTVSAGQNEYMGIVMAQSAPNGTWETGVTYDPADITGPVFVVTTDGHQVDLTAPFTISEMTAKDGSNIDSIGTTEYVYQTSNTSELLEQMESILALTQELEDRQPNTGGGGGDSDSGLPTMWLLLGGGAIVAVGAFAVMSRPRAPFP
ncbi:hypothetical protein [Haladaptatus cibarius]|uniref:hypothetical protein n=1 Tax=Haladaptatus cibarius TaxID=453847 RepID=UPI000678D057|nr:hypothetical protein [Haladaptatus cibarius]